MVMRRILASVLMALPAAAGGCAVVRVVDANTGFALEGAEVKCRVQPSGEIQDLGSTDPYGELFFQPPRGMDSLIVNKPGYKEASQSCRLLPGGAPAQSVVEVRMVPLGGGPADIGKEMTGAQP